MSMSKLRVPPVTRNWALSLSTTATTSWRSDAIGNRCLIGTVCSHVCECLSHFTIQIMHYMVVCLQYLSYCMGFCPRAYSDEELLLLLTVVGRIGLDPRLILQSSVELYPLQYKIVNNIRNWDTMVSACMHLILWFVEISEEYSDQTDYNTVRLHVCVLVFYLTFNLS